MPANVIPLPSSWETTKRAMKGLTVQLQLPPGLVRMWQQHQPIDGSGSSASPPERQVRWPDRHRVLFLGAHAASQRAM